MKVVIVRPPCRLKDLVVALNDSVQTSAFSPTAESAPKRSSYVIRPKSPVYFVEIE